MTTDCRSNEQIVAEAFTQAREPEYHISEAEDLSDARIAVAALEAAGRLAADPSSTVDEDALAEVISNARNRWAIYGRKDELLEPYVARAVAEWLAGKENNDE